MQESGTATEDELITRRTFAIGGFSALAGSVLLSPPWAVLAADGLPGEFAAIEAASGGRLGIAVLDTLSGASTGHRADERFPMCSTFKLLAAAAVLRKVEHGEERLDRQVRFKATDVVVNSPITKDRAGTGMSVAELCEAAMTVSDNTAGNLLLDILGGPAGLTAFARTLGDSITRLDRTEPTLNEAVPADPRDTTTPAAILGNVKSLALGDVLAPTSKEHLIAWLTGNKTSRIRAGLPADWRIGDKTGAGENGTTNDVGVIWPPNRAPVLVAVYLTGSSAPPEQRNATLAAVARAIAGSLR